MTDSYIDYDAKVQDALRHVVRNVLIETANDGLPGDHHFYVAFKTHADGVDIPEHLVSRFPDEMTIVIQHKFWGLQIHDDFFEIGLSFNQRPERLVIPFAAITGFVDPSVQFALQFHDENDQQDELELSEDRTPTFDRPEETIAANTENGAQPAEKNDTAPTNAQPKTGGDNIVTLDAFRRK